MNRRYLSVKEFAEVKRVHTNTVYAMIRRGDLPAAERVGRSIRIPDVTTSNPPAKK